MNIKALKKFFLPYLLIYQITREDFNKFDWIFGMDDDNISELERKKPTGAKAKIELLGQYDPKDEKIIRDPYYVRKKDLIYIFM